MLILSVQNTVLDDKDETKLLSLITSKIKKAHVEFVTRDEVYQTVFNKKKSVLFITQDRSFESVLNTQNNPILFWENLSDLASKLDIYLQLKRHLSHAPFEIKGVQLKEILSNSDNSTIYRAINKEGKVVAIKRFKFLPGFLTQARILNLIDHINNQCGKSFTGLVRLSDGGITDQAFYLTMEYLDKGSLRQTLDGCGNELPLNHALSWFHEIVLALDCVHRAGLIHRNLKIANILMRNDGSLALTNYGVSSRLLLESGYMLEHELYCSPHYVSPEQITGDACTQASDIYSLGVIFYELLTGTKPYSSKESYGLMMHHIMAPAPLLPEKYSQFQEVLDKMMAKNPSDRFSSATDVIGHSPLAA